MLKTEERLEYSQLLDELANNGIVSQQFTLRAENFVNFKNLLYTGCIDLINLFTKRLGLDEGISYRFSKWDPNNREKYMGTDEEWEHSQSVLKGILEKFSERVAIGDKCHSVVITTIKKTMYALVSLYGANHQFVVEFGKTEKHIVDMYICDWQHNKEYKLIDYVSDICKFNHEAEMED